jgi:hypothetical protein
MVGVSGDGEADARMVAIESLTPGTYLKPLGRNVEVLSWSHSLHCKD